MPLDFYKIERVLFSSLFRSTFTKSSEFFIQGLPLDFYKVERDLSLAFCHSTFIKFELRWRNCVISRNNSKT